MQIPYYIADVFTNKQFSGAQIAVVPEANDLSAEQMQVIAREFNLSETVFVSHIDEKHGHFRLRLFSSLMKEIEFGSHTMIAAAHVLSSIGKIVLDKEYTPALFEHVSGYYDVNITQKNGQPTFVQFSLSTEPVVDNYVPSDVELAAILSIEPEDIGIKGFRSLLVSSKGLYLIVPVKSFEAARAATFNLKAWSESHAPSTLAQQILLFCKQTESASADFHLRLLGPKIGVAEDPPVGSAIPSYAAYLCAHEHIQKGTYSFTVERGLDATRKSLLNVEMDNQRSDRLNLRVGGEATMVCEGKIMLP